ncbi:MAG: radical SAM protein [Proteobacteria bacterium]|nr:radical SAM protein [Pseudomonadota bacterium]
MKLNMQQKPKLAKQPDWLPSARNGVPRRDHLERASSRLEDLWLRGTDYSADDVQVAMAANKMLHLDMDFTNDCDINCYYCDRTVDRFDEARKRELTTEKRKALIAAAKALGATTVEFPGAGEPMVDPGFWEVIEYIHSQVMTPVIFTNGSQIDDAAARRLYDLGASVFLKYSSFDPELNDKLVGKPGYTVEARRALERLLALGFNEPVPTRLAIDMIIMNKHSLESIGEVHRWCRDNNVHHYISTLIPEGLADKKVRQKERQRSDEMLEYIQRIDAEEYGLSYESSRPMAGGYRCRQVNVGLFVNIYGEVYDCNGLGRPLGNVFSQSLDEIWNTKLAKRIRAPLQDGFCLVRERVWRGTEKRGIERKLEGLYNIRIPSKGTDGGESSDHRRV